MPKKMLIDATHPEETRVVVVDGNKVEDFDFETVNKRQLAGNIYLAKVTRVEPSLQAAFVDYGGNRHGFLAFAEIHPDYYQIPVADRKALIEEERAMQRAAADEENGTRRRRPQRPVRAESARNDDAVVRADIAGMDVVDLGDETGADALVEDVTPPAVAEGADAPAEVLPPDAAAEATASEPENGDEPYRALDHAADNDDEIESVAEEDVAEEIPEPRRPRHKKYKIQEVIKVRQIMLVQVVKEERGNKGAALTTYLSLAGRYCVLMPNTARGGGISRKITNAPDRKKLKEIASEIEVPDGAGLIIRTAGAKRTKPEIKRDYEYLCRLWEQIRELTFKSHAPAPIYEEGDLIKRTIRDLYSREIDEILVEGADGYRAARDFMKMIMPSQVGVVKPYADAQPLFARYQVESYLAGMFNPVVQLKSGGYIVIGVTEALVAIDINSGRATKEGSIEDTALKTNLEAADEIARQLRLRDLAGLIVIDFIDMEERRNNAAVEKRLKDALRNDRARIQVGRISAFGLMEMSRQRLRPGMLESTTQPCPHCHGTGLIRSDDSLALQVLRALEEEGTRRRSREVLLKAPIGIVNYLFNNKREHIAQIEARYGMAVRIEADASLISPDFQIEKFKTATRVVGPVAPVVSIDATAMPDLDEAEVLAAEALEAEVDAAEVAEEQAAEATAEAAPAAAEARDGDGGNGQRKKRRRRRRRRGGPKDAVTGSMADGDDEDDAETEAEADEADEAEVTEAPAQAAEPAADTVAPAEAPADSEAAAEIEAPKPRATRSRSRKKAEPAALAEAVAEPAAEAVATAAPARRRSRKPAADTTEAPPAEPVAEVVEKPKATRTRSRKKAEPVADAATAPADVAASGETPVAVAPEAALPDLVPAPPVTVAEAEPGSDWVEAPAPVVEAPADPAEAPAAEAEARPKRRGWWSIGR